MPRHTLQTQISNQGRPWSECLIRVFLRSSLIRVFPGCYSDKHYVNSSHENQHFIREKKEKSVQNFRTFTFSVYIAEHLEIKFKEYMEHENFTIYIGVEHCCSTAAKLEASPISIMLSSGFNLDLSTWLCSSWALFSIITNIL